MSTKLSVSAPHTDAVTEMVQRAAALREESRAADALPLLQTAVELQPDCGEYFYQLGRVQLDLENLDAAATALARAVDLYPAHWAARFWLGVTYVRLQEWEEAEEILALIAEHEPLFPGGHFYLGVAREELGKLDDAQLAYERVVVLDPSDARTHFFLGCLFAGRAQMQRARAEWRALNALDPALADELEECLAFCDAIDKVGPSATIAFVEKQQIGEITYEMLEAPDARTARAFLLAREAKRPGYYVRVTTPSEGTWGLDTDGLHLEKLLPFQWQLRSARTSGKRIGEPRPVELAAALSGQKDNVVVNVQCGSCGHTWPDGIRLTKPTVVRCPSCQTLSRIEPLESRR